MSKSQNQNISSLFWTFLLMEMTGSPTISYT